MAQKVPFSRLRCVLPLPRVHPEDQTRPNRPGQADYHLYIVVQVPRDRHAHACAHACARVLGMSMCAHALRIGSVYYASIVNR